MAKTYCKTLWSFTDALQTILCVPSLKIHSRMDGGQALLQAVLIPEVNCSFPNLRKSCGCSSCSYSTRCHCCSPRGRRARTLHASILPGEVDHVEGEEDSHHHSEREWTLPPAGHHEHALPALEGKSNDSLWLLITISGIEKIDLVRTKVKSVLI